MNRDQPAIEPLARYALLVAALAGRPLALVLTTDRHADARTFSDGTTVFVPPARHDEAWLDLSLQALLVRNGALAAVAVRSLTAQPARARAYLAFELARAVASLGALVPRSLSAHPAVAALPAATCSRQQSLERARSSPRAAADMAPAWGVLLPGRVVREQAFHARAASPDSDAANDEHARPTRNDAELESSRVLERFSTPLASSAGLLGQLLEKLLDLRRSPGTATHQTDARAAGAEIEVAAMQPGSPAAQAMARPKGLVARRQLAMPNEQRHPEWDDHRARYLRAWVHVAEVEADPDNAPEAFQPPRNEPAPALRRALARLSLGHGPRPHQAQGEALDIDALVRLRANALSGHVADERIYRASLRCQPDLGVLVLLDITGSTAERDATGEAVFERQLALALSLTCALHQVGNRVACYGFHGWGRKLVRFQRILSFDERPDARIVRRVSAISPVGYSRLGAAVRHGGAILRRDAGTAHKLLLMISDGIAYDHGYESQYARADTQRALAELRASRLAHACLSVGCRADADARGQLFDPGHHMSLTTLAGQERALAKLLERALKEVGRRSAAT